MTANLVAALERAWSKIQDTHPNTPDCVVVVAPVSRNGTYTKYGHYAPQRWKVERRADAEAIHAWGAEEHASGHLQAALATVADAFDAVDRGNTPEVLISAEGLERGARQVFRTLLHEAVHGIAAARGVQDTSRGGRYHNKRFAAIATEVGLTLEKDPRIGWITPDIEDETAKHYSDVIEAIEAALTLSREVDGWQRVKVPGGSSRNGLALICACEPARKIRMAESVLDLGPVICGVCDEEFRPEEPEAPAIRNRDFVDFLQGSRS